MNSIIIAHENDYTYVNLINDLGRLIECHPYSHKSASIVGNIYVGVVKKKVKGIAGYFVDIGSDKNGFLPINKSNNNLSPGESVIVQVDKDAYASKGAKLTTKLSFNGEYAVLVTDSREIHFSSKLPEDARTKGLKSIFKQYKSDEFGFIVRTNAYEGSNEAIKDEIEALIKAYSHMMKVKEYRPNYALLHSANKGWIKYVQNMNKSEVEEVLVESEEDQAIVNEYLVEISLHNSISVNLSKDLFITKDLESKIQKALRRKVWLSSGASIVIDRTEAMYVIDVNSDKNISKVNNQRNLLKINKEAAKEIAAQIRLRNLSGIILIDFIDLDYDNDQEDLLIYMEKQLVNDPVRAIVHGMTNLGIMELTRKRMEASLEDKLN